MAAVKTYILAPNFQYKPSGAIQIGNIIADPLRPAKALSIASAGKPLITESITEYNHELSGEKGRLLSTSLWAQFLQTIGSDIHVSRDVNSRQKYEIEELETHYLREEPSDEDPDITSRLAEPKVQAAVNAGLFGSQPVYLVTGVKIARGLTVRNEISRTVGGGIGTTVPVTESVSAGGEVRAQKHDGRVSAFKAGTEDIVFAYQLHVIRWKGRKKNARIHVYECEAALLHGDDVSGEASTEDTTIDIVTADDLQEVADEEGAVIDSYEWTDADGSKCVCFAAKYD